MKVSFECGSHKNDHSHYIGILPCLDVGKINESMICAKTYFVTFEWLLWYMVVYFKTKENEG